MNKVTAIHLGGRVYQLEEAGYERLREYLDDAGKSLEGNPDKDEIITDLELAIAEKCQVYLTAYKNAVTTPEVEHILEEMGPVGGKDKTSTTETGGNKGRAEEKKNPKRLYRIEEGSLIAGVCTGIAAFFDIDVTIVRLIFILLTIFSWGGWILIYFILAIIVPRADTPQERAEAFGHEPITAQYLINQAKEGYQHFRNSKEWRRWGKNLRKQAGRMQSEWRYSTPPVVVYRKPRPFHWIFHFVWNTVMILVIAFIAWQLYHEVPEIHAFFDAIARAFQNMVETFYQATQQ